MLSCILVWLLQIWLVCTNTGLVRPIRAVDSTRNVNCQLASQSAPLTSHSGSVPIGVITSYQPQCRSDRPELFEARQCSQHDCFCVNVSSGAVFPGTRASPSDVGDCSTALYSVLLAIRTPVYNWSSISFRGNPTVVGNYRLEDEGTSRLTRRQDAELRERIRSGLEGILNSVGGFQRVISVKQLISVSEHLPTEQVTNGLTYYRAQIVSVGHLSTTAPEDLIRHRLHEGHIPNVGDVDPSVSRIDLLEAKVKDPTKLFVDDSESSGADFKDGRSAQNTPERSSQDLQQSKSVIVRSSDPFAPAPVRSPSEKIGRESRQLPTREDEDTDALLSGAVIAPSPPQESGGIYQSWFIKSSRVNLLRQPGVIAGIVGSVVAFLLLLILFILFCIYRLRKKDEGSYALDEAKKLPNANYHRAPTREFYA